MKTIAFFNNKGGVGKTTLVYHLAYMFADLGVRTVIADFDPQANLTAMCLSDEQLEEIEDDKIKTIYDVVEPLLSESASVFSVLLQIRENLALIPGDLELSDTEDALSREWTLCGSTREADRKRAFKVTTALALSVSLAAKEFDAQLAIIDVGPNLGAINRAALLAADYVIVPVAPDLFSLKGLTNVGRGLRNWREEWDGYLKKAPPNTGLSWPNVNMEPLGYVISRFSTHSGKSAKHFNKWINRVPLFFHRDIRGEENPAITSVENDPFRLAQLKDYKSLMPIAMEARKPIFNLKAKDGAIGSHQGAAEESYTDFEVLAREIARRIDLEIP